MSITRLLLRYGWAIALREWVRWSRVSPEARVAVTASAGALIAPFVVFAMPVARLYWLITGRRLPGPLGLLGPPRYVLVNPFPDHRPPEIRELLARTEYNWEPEPEDIPRWLRAWTRAAQVLFWQKPDGFPT